MRITILAVSFALATLLAGCDGLPTHPTPSAFRPSNVNAVTGQRTQ